MRLRYRVLERAELTGIPAQPIVYVVKLIFSVVEQEAFQQPVQTFEVSKEEFAQLPPGSTGIATLVSDR